MARFSDEEKKLIDKLNGEITVTDRTKQQPYVFISYKSDDRLSMLRIVHRLNTLYGLRVYYDKEFAVNNELWVDQMEANMSSAHCYGMLIFLTKKYYMSYAPCMEMMHSHTSRCLKMRRRGEKEYLPLVPINLEKIPVFSDIELDSDTGLQQSNMQGSINAEKRSFLRYYEQLRRLIPGFDHYIPENNSCCLTVEACSGIINDIIDFANINENRFYESSFDSFCNTIAENIHNSVYKTDAEGRRVSVFDEEKYENTIKSFRSGSNAEPEPSAVPEKSGKAVACNDHQSYWQGFMDYAFGDEAFAQAFRKRNPSKDQTMNFSVGTSRCHITAARSIRRNSVSCELSIPDDKELFGSLKNDISLVSESSVRGYEWSSPPDKKMSSIRNTAVFSDGGTQEQYEWLKNEMLYLKQCLVEYIRKVTAE